MPRESDDIIDICSECFGLRDGSVVCWRGQNYTPQRPTLRVRVHNLIVALRNRRMGDGNPSARTA